MNELRAKQARTILIDRIKRGQTLKKSDTAVQKPFKKAQAVKKDKFQTGTKTHATKEMETGAESRGRGARQGTLVSWVTGRIKHVDEWKPD